MPNTFRGYVRVKPAKSIEQVLVKIQDNLEDFSREIIEKDPNDNSLLEDLDLEAAYENKIEHLLGRTPRGFYIARASEDILLPCFISADTKFLVVTVSCDCTVDLVVY